MTNVSTRPQVEATRRPKAAKTETRTAAPTPGPFWHQPTVEAHRALSALVNAAANLDDSPDRDQSNEAMRLVDMACEVIDRRIWLDESLTLNQRQGLVADYAYDAGSLIRGALHFPNQPLSLQCRTLLAHAAAIINALTEVHMSGSDGERLVPDLLEIIKIQPQPAIAVPPPSRSGHQPASTITARSLMIEGGEPARMLALQCTWDVEHVADAIINMADDLSASEGPAPGLARCFGTRIKALNSVLMSYLGDDTITLHDAQHSIYLGAQYLPEGAL